MPERRGLKEAAVQGIKWIMPRKTSYAAPVEQFVERLAKGRLHKKGG
jgi:hypothetical protein